MGGSLGVAAFGAVVAGQASFLAGRHISLTVTAVLVILTAAASLALRPRKDL
jgi:DHA2 family methylenomycin A resistance protein-like MFS transporter